MRNHAHEIWNVWSIVLGVLPHNATNKFIKKGKNKKNREVFKDLVADVEKNTNGFGTDLLPSLSSIGKRLEWAKKLRNLLPQDPKSWDDFPKEIPVNLTKMAQDEDFVLIYCITPGGKKIFGFASSTLLDVMSASEIWWWNVQCCQSPHHQSDLHYPSQDQGSGSGDSNCVLPPPGQEERDLWPDAGVSQRQNPQRWTQNLPPKISSLESRSPIVISTGSRPSSRTLLLSAHTLQAAQNHCASGHSVLWKAKKSLWNSLGRWWTSSLARTSSPISPSNSLSFS